MGETADLVSHGSFATFGLSPESVSESSSLSESFVLAALVGFDDEVSFGMETGFAVAAGFGDNAGFGDADSHGILGKENLGEVAGFGDAVLGFGDTAPVSHGSFATFGFSSDSSLVSSSLVSSSLLDSAFLGIGFAAIVVFVCAAALVAPDLVASICITDFFSVAADPVAGVVVVFVVASHGNFATLGLSSVESEDSELEVLETDGTEVFVTGVGAFGGGGGVVGFGLLFFTKL